MRIFLITSLLLLFALPAMSQESFPDVRSLTPRSETYPNPSPDGQFVIYSAGEGFALNLFRLDLETGETNQLTDNEFEDSAATYSPDGRQIVFQREDSLGNRDIWVMSAEGGAEQNITRTPTIREQHPRFSASGARIVYDANRDETEEDGGEDGVQNYEIYLYTLATGGIERLTDWPHWDMYPSLNPDGSQLVWRRAFTGEEPGSRNFDIMVRDLASGVESNLSNHSATDSNPHWSPAGGWIVFSSNRTSSYELFVIRPDGSDMTRITNGGSGSIAYTQPTFSVDGTSIFANRRVRGVTDMVEMELGDL